MATATSKLDILVNAKNNASPALKQVAGDLKGLDQQAGFASKGLQGLAAAGGIAGITALGTAAVSASVDMARLAAQATDVETSFRTMAGTSADSMFAGLKEASRGAISDFDLMLAANRSMLLGVADNAEEMAALMDVARARSQAMGITTTEAFENIITGIGRMSPLILDNLGIVVDQAAANEDYAESIGKTVAKLTEQEKKQALVNAVLRDSAELVRANAEAGDDAASNFERMDAAIANSKVALGEAFGPGVLVGVTLFTAYLQGQITMLEKETSALESAWVAAKNFATGSRDVTSETQRMAEAAGKADDVTRRLTFGLNALGTAAHTAGDGMSAAELKASNLARRLADLKVQSDATSAALASIRDNALGRLESAASSAVGVMGASEVARIYGPAKERLDAQIKAINQYSRDADYAKFKTEELADAAARPFTLAVEAAREAEKGTKAYTESLTDAEKIAEQAFENLRGKVEGVLSSALQHGTGVDPDELLEKMGIPRADAINENARRLADIAANGLKGQDWLGEFQKEVPDIWNMIRTAQNPQEEAAYLLRDFQDGLLTSAIDKGKAKEIVRRAIMGDQKMSELAQEIAQELATEMGVPLQEALASAKGALGVGGATGTAGTDAATSFDDGVAVGMEESNSGGAMVDSFVAQMRANYSKLKTAGQDAGKQWGDSFIAAVGENVPPALISLLTDLVSPGVMAKFAQQGTLTNAVP